ncbi:MAG: flagellar biosynthesis anti-sigma factor FlgM [Acetatifactor sp.]|nr:flagellar biosynthesis anti-sigma factor FlgM [Acetatifactor sp.]
MRIEAYNQVQQLYNTKRAANTQKSAVANRADRVQISSFGRDIQIAKAAVASAPDIREELTAPIKAKIQDGTYEVSNGSFAEKLMKKYEEMR